MGGRSLCIFVDNMINFLGESAQTFTVNKSKPNDLSDPIPDHFGNSSRLNRVSRLMTFFRSTFTISLSDYQEGGDNAESTEVRKAATPFSNDSTFSAYPFR